MRDYVLVVVLIGLGCNGSGSKSAPDARASDGPVAGDALASDARPDGAAPDGAIVAGDATPGDGAADRAPDGPPAAFVFGQPDERSNEGVRLGLALPNDVQFLGTRLLVADQNNSRVLIWNNVPTRNHQQADLVLGQPDFTTNPNDYSGVGPRGFKGTNGVASDGTKLFVSDRFNYRVLIWSTFPTTNFQPADLVLGQPDFTTSGPNTGGLNARSLTEPWVWLGGGKLFVADRNNVRVLIWNTIPTTSHAPADVVLGQPNMTSAGVNTGGLSASSFFDPGRGWVDGTRLFVPDLANHRVLIWNTIPTTDNAPADLVLGQPNMTTNGPNAGGAVGAAGLNSPIAVWAAGSTVAVADYLNNRVVVWTSPITANGQPGNVVIGQTSPTAFALSAPVTGATVAAPNAVGGDGTRLAVVDRFNNRILLYPTVPTGHGAAAALVLGQPDLVSNKLNNGGAVSAATLANPMGVAMIGTRLAIADSGNSRVVLWDAPPASRTDLPRIVLGQPDFITSSEQFGAATSARSMCGPWHVMGDGTRLFVGEQCGRRVGIWNTVPTASQQPMDLAVGQPDLTTSTSNTGGLSASSLAGRPQPFSDGQRLFVADPANNRVLVWNAIPTTSGKAADLVLGQPDLTTGTANTGGVSAQSLAGPSFVLVAGGKLVVADTANNRVLIWNAVPTANRAAADVVLGQPSMTANAVAATSARTLINPRAAHVDAAGRLYVADALNNRILYWNAVPTQMQAPADGVIGQPTLDSSLANNGGLTARTLQSPSAVTTAGDRVYIADSGNGRLVVLPRP